MDWSIWVVIILKKCTLKRSKNNGYSTETPHLCGAYEVRKIIDYEKWIFWVVFVSLVLNVIVMVGTRQLRARVEKIETTLGLQATTQSQQISPLGTQQVR
jgi:hypothetical protein